MISTRRGLKKLPRDELHLMRENPLADSILSGLPMAVLVINSDNKIIQVNTASEDFFGTSAKHIEGRAVAELCEFQDARLNAALVDPDANFAAHRADILLHGREKRRCDFYINILPADPDFRVVTLSPLPKGDPSSAGNLSGQGGFHVQAPDILAHEIKNPLAAIKGAAQLIGRGLNAEKSALTTMITTEVERIAKLLDQMQQLSTTQPAKIEPLNIHSLIDRARRAVEAGQGDGLEISDEFDPSLPEVQVDDNAMMQILTNLLVNAVEATKTMENRCVCIHTRYSFGASYASEGGETSVRLPVEIIISDNGPGIAPELTGDIFEPFVTSKNSGQGLGLALVRKLIRDMNGRIRYERDEQRELTQFKIFLPVAGKVANRKQEPSV